MKHLSIIAVLLSASIASADSCSPSRRIILTQYQREYVVKRQLLQYAVKAPDENLRRELKNKNPFVRWAASVELNRRWHLERAVARDMWPENETPQLKKGIVK